MPPDAPTEAPDTAGSVGPSGPNALVVYSDPRCPWAHVSVHRLLRAVEGQGVGAELIIDHRWFPLDDDAMPTDPASVDRKLEPFRALEPDLDWHRWADGAATFPASSRLAAEWVQGAKQVDPEASVALDRSLRAALFGAGRDVADPSEVEAIASATTGVDVEAVRAAVASERPAAELERHRELAGSDLVPASPTLVLSDGTRWTNPGIEFRTDDGIPVVETDDPGVYEEIIEAFLAQRHYD